MLLVVADEMTSCLCICWSNLRLLCVVDRQLWANVLGEVDSPRKECREGKWVNNSVQAHFGDLREKRPNFIT